MRNTRLVEACPPHRIQTSSVMLAIDHIRADEIGFQNWKAALLEFVMQLCAMCRSHIRG